MITGGYVRFFLLSLTTHKWQMKMKTMHKHTTRITWKIENERLILGTCAKTHDGLMQWAAYLLNEEHLSPCLWQFLVSLKVFCGKLKKYIYIIIQTQLENFRYNDKSCSVGINIKNGMWDATDHKMIFNAAWKTIKKHLSRLMGES